MANNVSNILDKTFYKEINAQNISRITNKEQQIKGVDIIFTYNDKQYLCDEKSAVRYRNLQTFSLELSFINRKNKIQEGWLTNDKYINDSFLFIWLDDDNIMEASLIEKQSLLDYLEHNLGWTKEKLRKKCENIRTNPNEPYGNIQTNGCKFSFSKHLVEQPINILLPRTTYKQIAILNWKKQIPTN